MSTPALQEQTGGRPALAGRALENLKKGPKTRVLLSEAHHDEAHCASRIEPKKLPQGEQGDHDDDITVLTITRLATGVESTTLLEAPTLVASTA